MDRQEEILEKLGRRIEDWFLVYHNTIREEELDKPVTFDFELLRKQLSIQILEDMKSINYVKGEK